MKCRLPVTRALYFAPKRTFTQPGSMAHRVRLTKALSWKQAFKSVLRSWWINLCAIKFSSLSRIARGGCLEQLRDKECEYNCSL